jgi:hypothetical protein
MHGKKVVLLASSIIIALILGYLIGVRRNADHSSNPIVKTYSVPEARASEIRYRLEKLFQQGEKEPAVGGAQLFGQGLMLVRAPEEFHAGIAELISDISHQEAPPKSPIHIDYWLVTGDEAKESNGQSFKNLSGVFSSIAKVDGPRKFRILEHLGFNSTSGQVVKVKGSIVQAHTTATLVSGHFFLNTEVISPLGDVESNTQIEPNDYIILAENSLKPKDLKLRDDNKFSGERDDRQTNVYHILHAELLK